MSLSNYLTTVSARAANPFGAVLAGACVLAAPAVASVHRSSSAASSPRASSPGSRADSSRGKAFAVTVPYTLTRVGVLMTPEPGNELEAEGVLNPATGHTPDGSPVPAAATGCSGNVSRVGLAAVELTDGVPTGVRREGVVLAPDEGWERGLNNAGVEDPRVTWIPSLGTARDDVRRLRAARAEARARGVVRTCGTGRGWARCTSSTSRPGHRPEPVPEQGHRVLPRAGDRAGRRTVVRDAAPADVGPRLVPRGRGRPPAGRGHRRPAGDLGVVRAGRRCRARCAEPGASAQPPAGGDVGVPVRGAEDRRRSGAAAGAGGLAGDPPRRDR